MDMTYRQAHANITWLYANYVSRYSLMLDDAIHMLDLLVGEGGWSNRQAYDFLAGQVLHDAAFYDEAFPGFMPEVDDLFDENAIPADLIVDYFHPAADDVVRANLIFQLESGAISNSDFVYAWPFVAIDHAAPGIEAILRAVLDHTDSVPILPIPTLGFPGISDAQADYLIGLYMASFGRAPEYAGLRWWAVEMASRQESGANEADIMRDIAMRLYDGGVSHAENGTDLADVAYVDLAYRNILGRPAESSGEAYWLGQIEQGLARGEFIVALMEAAQGQDRDYLNARIMVGRYAAQEQFSGPDAAPMDLAGVLDGVATLEHAYDAILNLLQTVDHDLWSSSMESLMAAGAMQEEPIALVGLAVGDDGWTL